MTSGLSVSMLLVVAGGIGCGGGSVPGAGLAQAVAALGAGARLLPLPPTQQPYASISPYGRPCTTAASQFSNSMAGRHAHTFSKEA